VGGRNVLLPLITPYKVGKIKTSFHVIVATEMVYNYDIHSASISTWIYSVSSSQARGKTSLDNKYD
jgi:hypothetical protein